MGSDSTSIFEAVWNILSTAWYFLLHHAATLSAFPGAIGERISIECHTQVPEFGG